MSQFTHHSSAAQREPVAQRARKIHITYPFSALVGQDEMKLALLLNAVSPQIAGVLVRGEKGTAKSTAVRALQVLLPEITVVSGCAFGCDPADSQLLCEACSQRLERDGALPEERRSVRLVELPLGATEDRVLGTLDLERALKDGIRQFEPGLLAAAHRGILYIDEVNLLPDHLVDALLDAATTGLNVVEREGISRTHPARFLLIGTMNPEEGDLRPQLLDRFGLSVEVHGLKAPELRAEAVRRRIAFEADPLAFQERWQTSDIELRMQVEVARRSLPHVLVPDSMLKLITSMCAQLDVEGLRADLTMYKAAVALAALEGRQSVSKEDIQRIALLALPHRRRRQPFEEPHLDPHDIEELINEYCPPNQEQGEQSSAPLHEANTSISTGLGSEKTGMPPPSEPSTATGNTEGKATGQAEQVIPPSAPTALSTLPLQRMRTHASSKIKQPMLSSVSTGVQTVEARARGRVVTARRAREQPASLALAPTLRAAALNQKRRQAEHAPYGEQRIWLERWDMFEQVRQHKRGVLILFAVDASGSMAARRRMATAKGAVLALLQRAYQKRDQVGLLQFRGVKATLLLPPTNSTYRASQALAHLPTGGRTPLASGLRLALRIFLLAKRRDRQQQAILVLVTDGRANVADADIAHASSVNPMDDAIDAAHELRASGMQVLVIDTEEGYVRTRLACKLAQELGGSCVELAALEASPMVDAVQEALHRTRSGSMRRNAYPPKIVPDSAWKGGGR